MWHNAIPNELIIAGLITTSSANVCTPYVFTMMDYFTVWERSPDKIDQKTSSRRRLWWFRHMGYRTRRDIFTAVYHKPKLLPHHLFLWCSSIPLLLTPDYKKGNVMSLGIKESNNRKLQGQCTHRQRRQTQEGALFLNLEKIGGKSRERQREENTVCNGVQCASLL